LSAYGSQEGSPITKGELSSTARSVEGGLQLADKATQERQKKMNHKRTQEISGSFLQGYTVPTTRRQISAVFGNPIEYEAGEKVSIEWGILFEDGTLATIYDWKRYELGTPDLDEEMIYNIGGLSAQAVARVEEALKGADKAPITRSLFIEGREWFDKVNGNSYFSARIWVDGGQVAILPFQYGYEDQYLYEAQNKLIELGYLPQESKNQSLHTVARVSGFDLYTSKSNTKKAEMFKLYESYKERACA